MIEYISIFLKSIWTIIESTMRVLVEIIFGEEILNKLHILFWRVVLICLTYYIFIQERFLSAYLDTYFNIEPSTFYYIDLYIDILFYFFVITFIPVIRMYIFLLITNLLFIFGIYLTYEINKDKIDLNSIQFNLKKYINFNELNSPKKEYILNSSIERLYRDEDINEIIYIIDNNHIINNTNHKSYIVEIYK